MFQLIALDIVLFTQVKFLKKLQKLAGKVLVALGAPQGDSWAPRAKFFALEPSNWTPAHFHIGKPGYAGVYLFFLFLLQNIDCGYSLEPPQRGGYNVTHNLCFEQK